MTLPKQRCLDNRAGTFSIGLQMFLLKIGVPWTCFEIALTWFASKGQTLDTGRIHQEQLVE